MSLQLVYETLAAAQTQETSFSCGCPTELFRMNALLFALVCLLGLASFASAFAPAGKSVLATISMLKVGEKAPDFELKDADGKSYKLSSYKGKKSVVCFFYPADSTPGCTKEACRFELDAPKFKKSGAEVFGVSSGGADSKKKFITQNSLSMPLLIDAGDKLRQSWAVPKAAFGLLPGRVTYVINKDGVVAEIIDDLANTDKHVLQSLAAVEKK